MLIQVPIASLPIERFRDLIGPERYRAVEQAAGQARHVLAGRVVWNVNSTARGGGVAELLRSLLAYGRGAGIDTRWLVIPGDPEFFRITKRIHNQLHGQPGDGGELGGTEHDRYQRGLAPSAAELVELVRDGDVVVLHDPQTAGLVDAVRATGAAVIWRCHVELALANDLGRRAWGFLVPHVRSADAHVFSRPYHPEGLDEAKIAVIPPSIDPFSAKNQELAPDTVSAILTAARRVGGVSAAMPVFTREDGSPARVTRRAVLYDGGERPGNDVPLVVQVSRWDRLKDPLGGIEGFARHIGSDHADDPEGEQVLQDAKAMWAGLAPRVRSRVHLACLPMVDGEENAAIVNALQRRASVVVQKSIAEGFGLTVAEAMWKGRAVVASRIGGIQEQIVHGESGLLIDDPRDLDAFGQAVRRLLADPQMAQRIGATARERVRAQFLGSRHLMQYVELFQLLLRCTG